MDVACVAGTWKWWAQEKTGAGEVDARVFLARARSLFRPTTSKRLLRRQLWVRAMHFPRILREHKHGRFSFHFLSLFRFIYFVAHIFLARLKVISRVVY